MRCVNCRAPIDRTLRADERHACPRCGWRYVGTQTDYALPSFAITSPMGVWVADWLAGVAAALADLAG
jgi:hypothetical protein